MPATLVEKPLGIACVFSDGTRAEFTLAESGNPQLARDLLAGLAGLVHPHGTVDAAGSVSHYLTALRGMVAALAERGFTGGAAGLRRAQLAEYWMGATVAREAGTRRMLQAFAAAGGGVEAGVRELVEGRAYNPQPYRRPLPPYRESEWARLTEVCQSVTTAAYRTHQAALAGAAAGEDPRAGGVGIDNLRWLLARTGPSTTQDVAGYLGVAHDSVRRRSGMLQASAELFPHLDVTVAYVLLFGVYSGIVPDGIGDLLVEDIDWAGDATVLLSYVKGRTAAESLTLPRPAVRLLERWLEHSSLLRGFLPAPQRRQLWLGVTRRGHTTVAAGPVHRNVVRPWLARHGVLGEDGHPLRLHRHRIRTTHQSMRDRSGWRGSGRAMIDPNHSPRVEGDHYLTATTPAQQQAVEAVIEDAQHDMIRRAQPPAVITEEDTVALARDYPQVVGALELDDTVVAELVGGARDVFTAACADQLSGLHGPKGKPCPARPWVCLLCPLAVFAPRHARSLLALKAFFARQWRQLPAAQFMAVFGPYAHRVGQILDRYDPAVLTAAASAVAGHDSELPLRPEELTT
jgi:hypothetical protein